MEIPDEDPLEVHPVADVVVWKEFEPCSNMLPHANGKILNDEGVIIHSSGPTGEPEVFEPNAWVCLPSVFGDVGGWPKMLGNSAFRMHRPKARGPRPSGLGLWSFGQRLPLGCVSLVPSMVWPRFVAPTAILWIALLHWDRCRSPMALWASWCGLGYSCTDGRCGVGARSNRGATIALRAGPGGCSGERTERSVRCVPVPMVGREGTRWGHDMERSACWMAAASTKT